MRNGRLALALSAGLLATMSLPSDGFADPCGMVPPLQITAGVIPTIVRTGVQRTWVFHKDGVETMALRPGFEGNVADFGMLIPFPSPPAIRKIADETFAHLEAAIDPPTLQVNIFKNYPVSESSMDEDRGPVAARSAPREEGLELDKVVVLSEEAIGMYQIAVLEAGSPKALEGWMTDNGYQYPAGMDAVTQDYVDLRWCFVVVKAKVGAGDSLNARPGMRGVSDSLPPGMGFDGHVQGMGFRFRVDEPVVPMRLSVFNGADPRNVVYMLTDQPVRIEGVPLSTVVRQVDGRTLLANVTQPIPVKFGGNRPDDELTESEQQQVSERSDPALYNRVARDLFASDLMAIRAGELALPHEDKEKALLNLSESLGLRGPEIDALHAAAISDLQEAVTQEALRDLEGLTLTVLDGIFPGDRLAKDNLTFVEYAMDPGHNQPRTDPIRPMAGKLTFYH
jgi:hypothetical protein